MKTYRLIQKGWFHIISPLIELLKTIFCPLILLPLQKEMRLSFIQVITLREAVFQEEQLQRAHQVLGEEVTQLAQEEVLL